MGREDDHHSQRWDLPAASPAKRLPPRFLAAEEADALGVPMDVARVIGRLWETAERDEGPDADFTTVIKPLEKAAGLTVGPSPR